MSLVNDALKRAQRLQQKQRDLPPPPLLRSAPPPPPNSGFWLRFLATALAVLGIILIIGFWKLSPDAHPPEVQKPLPVSTTPPPPAQSQAMPVQPVIAETKPSPIPPPPPAPPITNAPVLAPAKPEPSPLKLQAIFYTPRNPSAIINGKTVQIGDTFEGLRIVKINPDSVDLATPTQTNRLSPKGVSPHY